MSNAYDAGSNPAAGTKNKYFPKVKYQIIESQIRIGYLLKNIRNDEIE
jgi:hypothetical protein